MNMILLALVSPQRTSLLHFPRPAVPQTPRCANVGKKIPKINKRINEISPQQPQSGSKFSSQAGKGRGFAAQQRLQTGRNHRKKARMKGGGRRSCLQRRKDDDIDQDSELIGPSEGVSQTLCPTSFQVPPANPKHLPCLAAFPVSSSELFAHSCLSPHLAAPCEPFARANSK